jgi:RNA polymerase sigma-70 factor (ECF subfamily)
MVRGPQAGLAEIARLEDDGRLASYHYLPAARADLERRLGRIERARASYAEALALVGNDAERDFLQRRLDALPS